MKRNKFTGVAMGAHTSIYSYMTDEPLAEILVPGFFDEVKPLLRPHDRIFLPGVDLEVSRFDGLTVHTQVMATATEPAKRGPGRPKGAKNGTKQEPATTT